MIKCERCNIDHDGKYGSGRYCSKTCAFTKNENQLESVRKKKSEETKLKMRKPKRDSSKMGKYDKKGIKNPNYGSLKERNNDAYQNIVNSNKLNGQGWDEHVKKKHSENMIGEKNHFFNKTHTDLSKEKIKLKKLGTHRSDESILKQKNTLYKLFKDHKIKNNIISKNEKNICDYLTTLNIIHIPQFTIDGCFYVYDIYIEKYNLIIEYNGDFWHGNPIKYKETDMIGRGINKKEAKFIWVKDKKKNDFAIERNYRLEILWECDYLKENNSLIDKIINKYEGFDVG